MHPALTEDSAGSEPVGSVIAASRGNNNFRFRRGIFHYLVCKRKSRTLHQYYGRDFEFLTCLRIGCPHLFCCK